LSPTALADDVTLT